MVKSGIFAGDTWGWDGIAWVKIADNGPVRMAVVLGYDNDRHVIVAFGGGAPGAESLKFSDTWELKDNQWTQVSKGEVWIWNGKAYLRNKLTQPRFSNPVLSFWEKLQSRLAFS